MAFLVIENSIEETISILREKQDHMLLAYSKGSEIVTESKLAEIGDKLRCAEMYSKVFAKRSAYEKIKHKKHTSPEEYLTECRSMIKDIKGISFNRRDQLFIVRLTIKGEQKYIGAFDTPDDAIEVLNSYIQ